MHDGWHLDMEDIMNILGRHVIVKRHLWIQQTTTTIALHYHSTPRATLCLALSLSLFLSLFPVCVGPVART